VFYRSAWRCAGWIPMPAFPRGRRRADFSAWCVRTRSFIVCPEAVCTEDACAKNRIRDAATIERGWVGLKLEGPFPFSMTGVLASFVHPLAQAQIPIFAISTFDTDYVLIKRENLEQAVLALAAAGHEKLGEGDCG